MRAHRRDWICRAERRSAKLVGANGVGPHTRGADLGPSGVRPRPSTSNPGPGLFYPGSSAFHAGPSAVRLRSPPLPSALLRDAERSRSVSNVEGTVLSLSKGRSPLRSRRYYTPAGAKGRCKVHERQLWSAAACCRFVSGQLAGRNRAPGPDDREQARGAKAAASRRTPDLAHSKSPLNVPGVNLKVVLDMDAIDLHLHDSLIKRGFGAALEPARRAPGIK